MALTAIGLLTVTQVSAQSYYDDDIYGTPAKKTNKSNTQKTTKTVTSESNVIYDTADDADYNSYYGGYGSSSFDVDAYNRHGSFLVEDQQTAYTDSLGGYDNFQYTQRLEKFHNPDVVTGSNDEELVKMYYSSQPSPTVNIYVNNDPFLYPCTYNYGWNWGWNNWYWNNWYWNNWYWGPSWNYYGYYNPYWGYYPSWSWGPGWGYTWAPAYNWRPVSRPGASSLHRPVGGSNVAHSIGTGTNTRPGNMGRPTYNSGNRQYYTPSASGSTTRPGSSGTATATRPGNSGNKGVLNQTPSATVNTGFTPSASSVSGTVNASPSLNTRGRNSVNSSNTSTTTKNTTSNRTNNYNNNSNRSGSTSRGSSFSTGSRGGSYGGGMGGTRGGGSSGGGRGRR